MMHPPNRCHLHGEELLARLLCTVYRVGPTEPVYHAPDQVPYSQLLPGDQVLIDYAVYHSKIDLTQGGAPGMPIVVEGLPGPEGQLPVLDGRDAVENVDAAYWTDEIASESLVTVAPAASNYEIGDVTIENLEVRNANSNSTYTAFDGSTRTLYNSDGISIYIAHDVTIEDCDIHDNGQGIFGKSYADPYKAGDGNLSNIQVIGNHIYNNGVVGDDHEHDTYLEGISTVYLFNRYGPLLTGAEGMALKDRSYEPVIAYNDIEGGANLLDLVEPQDGAPDLCALPGYGQEWVYGNVLFDSGSAAAFVWFGYDNGVEYSQQKLYFYDNTVVGLNSYPDGGYYYTGVFKVTGGSSVYAFDNVFHLQSTDGTWAGQFFLSWAGYAGGTVYVGVNVGDVGMFADDGSTTTIGWQNMVLAADPGFVDVLAGDYRLAAGSPAIGAAQGFYDGTFHDIGVPDPTWQYDPTTGTWIARSSWLNAGGIETDPPFFHRVGESRGTRSQTLDRTDSSGPRGAWPVPAPAPW